MLSEKRVKIQCVILRTEVRGHLLYHFIWSPKAKNNSYDPLRCHFALVNHIWCLYMKTYVMNNDVIATVKSSYVNELMAQMTCF